MLIIFEQLFLGVLAPVLQANIEPSSSLPSGQSILLSHKRSVKTGTQTPPLSCFGQVTLFLYPPAGAFGQ